MTGDRQAQGMGIAEQGFALLARQLREVGELMNIGAMDRQCRPGFTQHGQGRRIAAISDHSQALEQGGAGLGNR